MKTWNQGEGKPDSLPSKFASFANYVVVKKNKYDETSDISKAQTSENQLNQPNQLIAFDPNNSMQEKEIKGQVEKLLQTGLIKESNSPYSAPETLSFKRDEGKKTRFCIDFRKLNALCKADSEPLPIMDSLLDKLARANFFSTLDLASGYCHVPIHPKDTEKLTFCTNFGLYEWCRLPFGIKLITLKQMVKMNVTLVTRLKCKVNASSTKVPWTKLLDQVCNEYNSTQHSITKYPPAYLLFGLLPYQSPLDQNNCYEPVDEAHELTLQREQ
ncbi:retrovirus-related Pol polyprotein from transposon 17.6 [Trichonephila clavipes]|nr:retrovirus-related Pol polyprotein from transposon 17.6 [Trichonephila clavipes]